MIKFITDSSCDTLSYKDVPIEVVPLKIYTNEREFVDTADLDVHEMLDYLLAYKDRSFTACPNTQNWLKAYEGGDEFYVVTLTSQLSGAYNSACGARDIYLKEHPDAKFCIIDTLSTGPEMRLMIEQLIEWKQNGFSFEEIERKSKDYLAKTRLFFAFKSLHNLAQNGRVNKIVASVIGKLNISILGTASEDGKVEPTSKCRGTKNVLEKLSGFMTEAGFKGGKLRICHIENEELAKQLGECMKKLFPNLDLAIYPARGLCSFYGERGGIIIGCEC